MKLFGFTIILTFIDYLFYLLNKFQRSDNQFGEKYIDYIAGCNVRYYNPSTEGIEITIINFVFLFSNFIALTFIFNNKSKIKMLFNTFIFTYLIGFLFFYTNVFLENRICNVYLVGMYNPFYMIIEYFLTIIKSSLNNLKYSIVYFFHIYMCIFFIKGKDVIFFKKYFKKRY